MDEVRWGMIGCGNVTEVKSGPAFNKIEHSRLVAVMGRRAGKAQACAARHGIDKWYTDAGALLADPEVNAVYIATPPGSHLEYTLQAAAAGKPVYVEKPMARSHAECQEMIGACQAAGRPLFVAYYRRALPRFLKIKELLDGGAIGDVRFVQISFRRAADERDRQPNDLPWRVLPEHAGGGYFVDLASHMLDFLDFALGPITDAAGRSANQAGLYPAEDVVCASFRFAGGALGCGAWCFTTSPESACDYTEIVGSKGRISYSTFGTDAVRLETADGRRELALPTPENIQQPLIQTIVDELRGVGACPSTGVTGARTDRAIDAILGRSGGKLC